MSLKQRMKAADPLRAASPTGLAAPDVAALKESVAEAPLRQDGGRRRAPLRQILATGGAVALTTGIAAALIALVPGRENRLRPATAPSQRGRSSSVVPAAPAGPLWILRFADHVSGAPTEHVSGILHYRIPSRWRAVRQTENSMAFTIPLEGCTATTTVSAHVLATSERPALQVHAVLYQYDPLARGARRVAPTGPWGVGYSDGTKVVTREGYTGRLGQGMTGVSVMPLARANRYLQFRLYTVGCGRGHVHTRDVLNLAKDAAGVLANVSIQRIAGNPPLG